MSRASRSQAEPDPNRVDATFPSTLGDEGTVVHRATGESKGVPYTPGYFDSSADGRFNLQHPKGTLYVALHPRSAVLEKLQGLGASPVVPWHTASQIHLWQLQLGRSLRLAELQSQEAENRGVTQELVHGEDYELAQRWAVALDEASLHGISYTSRYTMDPDPIRRSWAVFGPAGPHLPPFVPDPVGPVALPLIAGTLDLEVGPPARFRPPPPTT